MQLESEKKIQIAVEKIGWADKEADNGVFEKTCQYRGVRLGLTWRRRLRRSECQVQKEKGN